MAPYWSHKARVYSSKHPRIINWVLLLLSSSLLSRPTVEWMAAVNNGSHLRLTQRPWRCRRRLRRRRCRWRTRQTSSSSSLSPSWWCRHHLDVINVHKLVVLQELFETLTVRVRFKYTNALTSLSFLRTIHPKQMINSRQRKLLGKINLFSP